VNSFGPMHAIRHGGQFAFTRRQKWAIYAGGFVFAWLIGQMGGWLIAVLAVGIARTTATLDPPERKR